MGADRGCIWGLIEAVYGGSGLIEAVYGGCIWGLIEAVYGGCIWGLRADRGCIWGLYMGADRGCIWGLVTAKMVLLTSLSCMGANLWAVKGQYSGGCIPYGGNCKPFGARCVLMGASEGCNALGQG